LNKIIALWTSLLWLSEVCNHQAEVIQRPLLEHSLSEGMSAFGRKAVGPLAAKLQPFASTPITIIFMRRAGIIFAKPE
jgi:hypothetical protein